MSRQESYSLVKFDDWAFVDRVHGDMPNMPDMPNMRRRICVCMLMVGLLCGLGACSGGQSARQPSSDEAGSGEKLAATLVDYIDVEIDRVKSNGGDDRQVQMLERARDAGSVPISDYEQAWSDYRQCMVDKGEPEPVLVRYGNGMYTPAPVSGSDKRTSRFFDDQVACLNLFVDGVQRVYGVQIGNPNLYGNQDEAIVDCLRREAVVPKSYTTQQLAEDRNADDGEFDDPKTAAKAKSCSISNGWPILDARNDPHQDLGE